MQQQKQVVLWKPKRAEKLSPQGKPMPGEYVGKFATRVPEGTPGAFHNVGSNDAGKAWDFWETHVDSVAGNLRWIDKRDGGEYGTTLEVFLESNQFLHQISFKYDGFVLKDVLNHVCGLQNDIATHYISLSYWVRKAEKDGVVQTDKDGKPVWRKSASFRDMNPLFSYEQWMTFAKDNDLMGFHRRKANGTKEWVDDASIKFWDEKLVTAQRLLLKTDTCLPFCYNSFTACEAPNPSGGGNLTAAEIAQCKSIYEAVRPLYRFPFTRTETNADDALAQIASAPATGYEPGNPNTPDPFAARPTATTRQEPSDDDFLPPATSAPASSAHDFPSDAPLFETEDGEGLPF
jgi:hypothetical protein